MKLEIVPREGLPGETVNIASEPSLTNRLSRPEAVDKSAEVMWVTMNRRITSRQDGSTISNNECAPFFWLRCLETANSTKPVAIKHIEVLNFMVTLSANRLFAGSKPIIQLALTKRPKAAIPRANTSVN